MNIQIIQTRQDNGLWYVTFKYYKEGECACHGKKTTKSFYYEPTNEDLIMSLN